MRVIVLIAVALVAGCAPASERARAICAENGHSPGSAGFDRCFETSFAAILGAPAQQSPAVYNRVGNAVVRN